MKKFLFLSIYIILSYAIHAQVLYGTTEYGGSNNSGTISKLVTSSNTLSAAFSFDAGGAGNPFYSSLVQATNGKLYGMTYSGGVNNQGAIFSYDPSSAVYSNVWNFEYANGTNPYGGLIQATDGKLYGMTTYSGSGGAGTIFSFDPATTTFTKLKDFDGGNDGGNPEGSFLQATNGRLYAITTNGGSNGAGVIFSFDPGTSVFTKLKDFGGADGSNPGGSLMQAGNLLYGTTYSGGINGTGVIFSFNVDNNNYTDLKDLDNTTDGGNPNGTLVLDNKNGFLYGTTSVGGGNNAGVIFSFDPATGVYNNLKDLNPVIDGGNPYGSLVQATDGKFYGLTTYGGSNDAGVIFSFDPENVAYSNLKSLDYNTDGGNPYGSVMQASDGKLYGMTFYGGSSNQGMIFSFDPVNYAYAVKKQFGTNNTGNDVYSGLVKDNTGTLLYGMTYAGGKNGNGVIFSFNHVGNIYTNLWNFDGANGGSPDGGLVQANNGKLYGMASGGSNNAGVIFSFDPSTATYTKLKDFDYNNSDGVSPCSGLMQASDGKLYGMTIYGGSNNEGVIFSLDPATNLFTKLKDLGGDDGGRPVGSLMQASDGKLYGMTTSGGSNYYGVIFSYDPATTIYTKLKEFDYYNDGASGDGNLVQATNGKLYGLSSYGGPNNVGTIFSFDPVGSVFTTLKSFDGNADGGYPYGSLVQASNGKLYGMTSSGGSSGSGTVFSFDPSYDYFSKLRDYVGTNGASPQYTSFTELTPLPKLTIYDAAISEGNSGTKLLKFKVALSSSPLQTVTVNYKTINKTATAPSDYIASHGTLSFAPGIRSKTIAVTIAGDRVIEPDETFKIALSNAVNATIKDGTGIGTILNDDNSTISGITAINLYNTSLSLAVSPNPATNLLKIELTGYTGNVRLQLIDLQGKVLNENKLQATDEKHIQQQLNVSALANGNYFVVVQDDKGNKQSEKVIVAH